ncbi:MAG: queuosine precursor transporter [Bacteroidota bacterium]
MNPASPSSTSSNSTHTEHLLAVFACLFITFLIVTKIVAEKYFLFIGAPVSCRAIIYPFTLLVIHVVTELYGPQQGSILIAHGLRISIIVSILLWIARKLPIAADSPVSTADFESVLGASLGVTISALVAYLAGQLLNLYLFVNAQNPFNTRSLWLRSMSASLGAQLVDTFLLGTALYVLGATLASKISLFNNMLGQYTLQALVTFFSTPFVHLSIALSRQQMDYKTTQ